MNRTFLRRLPRKGAGPIAAAALLALSSGTAWAATYVAAPLPPEFGGGVVPADPKVLKNDQKASATVAKLAATVEKCFAKGVANVSKGAPSGLDTCLNLADKGALPKFQAAIAKIDEKAPGLSSCYDFAAAGIQVANTVKAQNAIVYCAGTTALDPEFGGGFVPPDGDTLKNVQKASKELAKLWASIEKCYSKGVGNFSKAKATGVDTCLNDPAKGVLPKFQAKIGGITLPPCADFATLRTQVEGIVKASNTQYCGCSKAVAKVSTTFSGAATGVSTILGYPGDQADIPGFGSQPSVVERVANLTGINSGTFSYGDNDTNADLLDDQLSVGLLSIGTAIPSGPFITATFDCKAGQAAVTPADFACTLDASDNDGATIPGTCAVSSVSYLP
ncbi:hypothetical protein K2Z84_27485 [Candidatus Binatia bacterium]|jgi:hypothetical protein|nr:hypothetical protein [Candidatus Binatia bacterium]